MNVNYGYTDDSSGSSMVFGLNAGKTTLKKFGYTANGGKNGAAGEALDIVFNIDGKDVGYRQFPVVKAYEDNKEITDSNHPAMIKKAGELGAVLVHIVGCFTDKDQIKAAFSKPITSFKEYCDILTSLLPEDYSSKKLDIFLQYQTKIKGDYDRTFLELPKNMKQGKWLIPAYPHKGSWVEKRMKDPTDKIKDALYYVDSEDPENIHPFVRSGWFMNQNYSKMLTDAPVAPSSVLTKTNSEDESPFKETPPKKAW